MFTVEQFGPNMYHILLETDEVRIVVGEVTQGRGWEFHHRTSSAYLKPDTKAQLTVFGRQQAELRQITARLLK